MRLAVRPGPGSVPKLVQPGFLWLDSSRLIDSPPAVRKLIIASHARCPSYSIRSDIEELGLGYLSSGDLGQVMSLELANPISRTAFARENRSYRDARESSLCRPLLRPTDQRLRS